MMIISKIWTFKLSDIDQGIQNMSYRRKRSLKRFWQYLWREKEENSIIVYPVLRYTHTKLNFACKFFFSKNVCLSTKIFLQLKKKQKKIWGKFQKYVVVIKKKASHAFFMNGNCMTSIFLTKNFCFLFSTIHRILCQNEKKVARKFNDTILAKCMKFVWFVFFHRLSLWNCMSSVFGLWRPTRGFKKILKSEIGNT